MSATPARITREFDDNASFQMLLGPHNVNLARIERQLGVSLIARGNRVAIQGEGPAVDAARAALDSLYDRARRGVTLEPGDVDAAVRMAGDGDSDDEEELAIRTRRRLIYPRSPLQAEYIRAMGRAELVFGLGPAGTGKTYLAVAKAVAMLTRGKVDRLVLSRPAVEAGERLGFLPGDLKEKVDPYLRPLYDALHDMLPADQVAKKLASGEIEVAPLAFMRGRTLANAFVILDEAQNTSPMQMKMFLTRMGEHARMVVTGDLTQIDLPPGTRSGLLDALETVKNVDGIETVRFSDKDVVRHGLVTRIVRAYDKRAKKAEKTRERGGPDDASG